ncbi:MAG TPA: hypothetical protein VN843_27225 [Anaerolineales bacterium]|nr:hypothetical protein [Anaerolineales bacterium]
MSKKMIAAEITPTPNQASQASKALQDLGFRILHLGPTISVQGSQALWKRTFKVSFKDEEKTASEEAGIKTTYPRAQQETVKIPEELKQLIAEIAFVEPPELF